MATIGFNEIFFLLQGLKWTVALTIIGFIGGGIFGLLVALARTAESGLLRKVTTGYIAIFQGTPLLMQLFVVYYGVALIGLNVDAWIAVAIAFTLHASAYLARSGAAASRRCRRARRKRPRRLACTMSRASRT